MKNYLLLLGLCNSVAIVSMEQATTVRLQMLLKSVLESHKTIVWPRVPRFLGQIKAPSLGNDPQESNMFNGFYPSSNYHQVTYVDKDGNQRRSDFIEYVRSYITGIETDLKTKQTRVTSKIEERSNTTFVAGYSIAKRPETF